MLFRKQRASGKFVLFCRKEKKYFQAMGKFMENGMPPERYMYWTRFAECAGGFPTFKQARAMQRKLLEEGYECIVVTREREAVL